MLAVNTLDNQHSISCSQFHASEQAKAQLLSSSTPLLNQWHHLIGAMRTAGRHQWVTLINPPFIPNEKYLNHLGLGDLYIRTVWLKSGDQNTERYVRKCLQNGKSTLVAIWLDEVLLPEDIISQGLFNCSSLVFSHTSETELQLEMAV